MRIVYVEDNLPNQSLVERIAHSGQHQVVTYPTAEDALHHFDEDQPDILLVDVELAGPMDGLEFVRRIRSAGIDLPIIAITSVAGRDECMEAGCDAYFVKPVPVQDLYNLLEQYATS
jgi:CheY-like chemotaxis protein